MGFSLIQAYQLYAQRCDIWELTYSCGHMKDKSRFFNYGNDSCIMFPREVHIVKSYSHKIDLKHWILCDPQKLLVLPFTTHYFNALLLTDPSTFLCIRTWYCMQRVQQKLVLWRHCIVYIYSFRSLERVFCIYFRFP